MWTSREEAIPGHSGVRYEVAFNGRPATFGDVVETWLQDDEFRSWFNSLLSASPYSAFRWETPGVSLGTVDRLFEFVLLDDPRLARQPDVNAFARYFPNAKRSTRRSSPAGRPFFNRKMIRLQGDAQTQIPILEKPLRPIHARL